MAETNRADARIIEESETGCEYRGKDVAHKITQILADSTEYDFSPHYGTVDLVYIDGALAWDRGNPDTNPVTDFSLGTAAGTGGAQ